MPLTSFYTALTGINNNSTAINVIGDNLANMNTTAFKSGKATFSELLAGLSGTSTTGNPVTAGLGSTLNGVVRTNTQGTVTSTGVSTDAAINGNGFFVVSLDGGLGFTRSGSFQLDKEGNLLSADGFQLLGYAAAGGTIDTSGAITPIQIKKGQTVPGSATTEMSVLANLDAQAATNDTFSSSIAVYDSVGVSHQVTLTFTKTGAGAWSWAATVPAEDTGGTAGGTPTQVGTGTLTFDQDGKLDASTTNPTIDITGLASGAADMSITLALTDATGNSMITGFASASAVSSTNQNGYTASNLTDISISSTGVIIGATESGQSVNLAQLALANFPNIDGLAKSVGSTFVAFTTSGEPSIGTAGTGGRGLLVGGALEKSNVDMAKEFIDLITAQRAYQANSKMISTTDQLYQDAVNLIR
jgi:flagellar hook protein FlgE